MHPWFQIILSILPYYFDFPLDKLPNSFSESAYVLNKGEYIDIENIDRKIRLQDIRSFFLLEKNGWSYNKSIASYVPGYMLKSDKMVIDYSCSYVSVKYRENDHWVLIGKKVSSPFPMLIDVDEGRCRKK